MEWFGYDKDRGQLYSNPNDPPGWRIKIMGLSDPDRDKFFHHGNYELETVYPEGTPPMLVVTPKECPRLSADLPRNPPMEYVTQYLNTLKKNGFHTVGTHTMTVENAITLIWTLEKTASQN